MRLLRATLAGVLGACAALVVACGDSNGLLAQNDASSLSSQLDSISEAVDGGHCATARRLSQDLENAVINLPGDVDRRVLTDLQQGARTVGAQSQVACQNPKTDTTTTETETATTETQTVPTQTQTVPTETQTQTVPTQTVPTTPTTTPTTPTTPTPTAPTQTTPGTGGAGTGGGGTSGGGTGTGGAAPGQ